MPVACRLSNMTRVTRELVKTFSRLPACFIAGRKNIAAVLPHNININILLLFRAILSGFCLVLSALLLFHCLFVPASVN